MQAELKDKDEKLQEVQDKIITQVETCLIELQSKYQAAKTLVSEQMFLQQASQIIQEKMNVEQPKEQTPSLEKLLTYKDRLHIPDDKWKLMMQTFALGHFASLHQVRNLCSIVNSILPSMPTGGNGYQIVILDYLQWLLEQQPPVTDKKPIIVKFCFDNGTMTLGKRIGEELGAFELLYEDQPLEEIKSPSNCHVWLIYIGSEEQEELEKKVKGGIDAINYLIHKGTIAANGTVSI